MSSRLFFGGLPTGMDVDKLTKELSPQPGEIIPYEDIEIVLIIKRTEHRFATVLGSWRKRLMKQRGLQSQGIGTGIQFLTPDQSVDKGVKDLTRIGKATGRMNMRQAMINPIDLTPENQRRKSFAQKPALRYRLAQVRYTLR